MSHNSSSTSRTMPGAASPVTKTERHYTVEAPDGVRLAVQESGNPDGPSVIFIHGLLGSRLSWEEQVDSDVLQAYRLITYDLRGHGLSGKPVDAQAYSEGHRWADDLAAVIAASKAHRPVLVGWSLGAAVISNYLAARGDHALAGIVYVNGVIELREDQIVSHPQVYHDMVAPDLKTHLDGERSFLELCFHTRPDASTMARLLASAAMASWHMQSTVQSIDVAAARGLGRTTVPVRLIYGRRDRLVKADAAIARAKTLNARIESSVYTESGHSPFLEEATRFNEELASFIETVSPLSVAE